MDLARAFGSIQKIFLRKALVQEAEILILHPSCIWEAEDVPTIATFALETSTRRRQSKLTLEQLRLGPLSVAPTV